MTEIMKLDDRPIKSIGWWWEPEFNNVEVGKDDITKIDCVEHFCGEYSIYWIQVWKGNKISARYNARNVDSIFYG